MKEGVSRKLKTFGKRVGRHVFEVVQRAGVDILPRHYYSPIPDHAELRRNSGWRRRLDMIGVRGTDLDEQLAFARGITAPHRARLVGGEEKIWSQYCTEAGEVGFGVIEADFLFCFIATRRPAKVIQVGCGASSAVVLGASAEAGHKVDLVCVEPYPSEYLRRMDREGRLKLYPHKAQDVPREVLSDVGPGDLLFIDSTHTVKPGSEVNRLILDVLPRLPRGAIVHFHDINFPYDYDRSVLESFFYSGETSLLFAFLIHNDRFSICCSLSMLHYDRPEALSEIFPRYRPASNDDGLRTVPGGYFPSSTYLEVVG